MTQTLLDSPATGVAADEQLISVVLPVYNEDQNIGPCLRSLWTALQQEPHEILVCYDFDGDSTLEAIAKMPDCPTTVRLVKNTLGRGVACALQAGFNAARGDVIVSTMADMSDPPEGIVAMAERIRRHGADVVSGSRYMRGGSQTGGPWFKGMLSRWAGLSLCWIAGFGTHDATNNFRGYSARFLKRTPVQSKVGFEVALELTVKAHLQGYRVDEVPSSWQDRTAGQSRFKLLQWLPRYLMWFAQGMLVPCLIWAVWLATLVAEGVVQGREALWTMSSLIRIGSIAGAGLAGIVAVRRLTGRMRIWHASVPLVVWGAGQWMTFTGSAVAVPLIALAVACAVLCCTTATRRPNCAR